MAILSLVSSSSSRRLLRYRSINDLIRSYSSALWGARGLYLIFSKRESRGEKTTSMRGAAKLPVQNIIKQICPRTGTCRVMTVSTPQRHERNELREVDCIKNEHVEQLVAFDKPRMPPVLGPLIIYSLLEMSRYGHTELSTRDAPWIV
ncbi:hypothetical protein ACMD2_12997 [Ananas comosus]|uniref:Uncharacterized protein n=1 Tax=Ananas comosus TaxID=4615 RepID=A0A199V546_ANACO|nr:hypothetical protein ACMD2_12997 [Ananas comosus]